MMLKQILFRLNNLSGNYPKVSLDSLTISISQSDFEQEASRILKLFGILIITDVLDRNLIDGATMEIDDLILKRKDEIFEKASFFENNSMAFQKNLARMKTYNEINQYRLPVVNMRSDNPSEIDGGMIDVFNIDKIKGFELLKNLYSIYQSIRKGSLKSVLSKFVTSIDKSSTHLYINKGVVNTRPIHFDNLDNTYKVFVYLTDVTDLKHGPYSYVPGSHKIDGFIRRTHRLNKFYNHFTGDMPYYNQNAALPILGSRGTIIVTSQNGLHGGYSQGKDAFRLMYVDTFLK